MRTVEAKLRPTSLSAYKDAINGHTVLGLGAYRVKQLTARRIKEWLTGLHVGTREKPVSPATTKRARPILNELLELAKTAYCPP